MNTQTKNTTTEVVGPVMSTKELAETLGVSVRTVQKIIANKGYEINFAPFQTNGGIQKLACVSEAVATAIKIELQNHSKVAQNGFSTMTISNDLEAWELQKRLDAYKDKRIAELQKENEQQKQQLAEQKPKVIAFDRIADGKGCFTVNQAAKALKLPYGNRTLFKKLQELGILNQDNTPRQEQTNNGNFKVVVKFINDTIGNKNVTLVTSKGLTYLAKKFNTTIDENVKADA
jgi:phage antirepressor YoqD-like protein